jgi:hypothetical protein
MRRRDGNEGPHVRQRAFATAHGRFDQLWRNEIPVNFAGGGNTLRGKSGSTLANGSGWGDLCRHACDPLGKRKAALHQFVAQGRMKFGGESV